MPNRKRHKKDDLKCKCGKILTDDNVCPIPEGKECKGKNHIVRPLYNLKAFRKGIVTFYAEKAPEA